MIDNEIRFDLFVETIDNDCYDNSDEQNCPGKVENNETYRE